MLGKRDFSGPWFPHSINELDSACHLAWSPGLNATSYYVIIMERVLDYSVVSKVDI